MLISIHSTARVETQLILPLADISLISIHSTARVETASPASAHRNVWKFQSTPPRGWRRLLSCQGPQPISKFQSTPPRGWRLKIARYTLDNWAFQSTPPRGWRQVMSGVPCCFCRFQSTPPRGWRHKRFQLTVIQPEISIHSTARVETLDLATPASWTAYFNPLHREGGDRSALIPFQMVLVFQSTPPRGWRPGSGYLRGASIHFNPLHREGGDAGCKLGAESNPIISIHSTARVETL